MSSDARKMEEDLMKVLMPPPKLNKAGLDRLLRDGKKKNKKATRELSGTPLIRSAKRKNEPRALVRIDFEKRPGGREAGSAASRSIRAARDGDVEQLLAELDSIRDMLSRDDANSTSADVRAQQGVRAMNPGGAIGFFKCRVEDVVRVYRSIADPSLAARVRYRDWRKFQNLRPEYILMHLLRETESENIMPPNRIRDRES
ncbi:unnamed protein product [Amoebophrya sp. A120]|nr:unnamed protein product [Amoebophrya sp. A120]|eukprot:GSA120T00001791001.1